MHGRSVVLALVLLAGGAAGSAAQPGGSRSGGVVAGRPAPAAPLPADVRQGFWYGGGLAAGSGGLHCSICTGEQEGGGAIHLRSGTTLTRYLLLGGELGGWRKGVEDGSRRVLSLTGTAHWYPDPRHGYYLKAGAGLSEYRTRVEQEALTARAFALQVGAGYEIRVNPSLSLAPFLGVLASSRGTLWREQWDAVSLTRSRLPVGANTLLLQLGLGLTRH
jgi:hypothetical protein